MKKLEKAKLEESEEEEEVVQAVQGNKKDISREFNFRFQNPVRRGGFKKNFDRDQEGGNRDNRDGGRQRYPLRGNRDNRGFGGRGRNNYNQGQRRNNQPKKEKALKDILGNEAEFPALG